MNISDMESGQVLYLEDLKELYAEGSVETATEVKIVVQLHTEDSASDIVTEIVSGKYYGNLDGVINLDFSKTFSALVKPAIPEPGGAQYLGPRGSHLFYVYLITLAGLDTVKMGTLNAFSKDARSIISDMDYMAVPDDARLMVNFHSTGYYEKAVVSMETADGKSQDIYTIQETGGLDSGGIYSLCFNVSDLPVDRQPFRIAVAIYGGTGIVQKMYSCIYECVAGDFQQYIFSGRLGGYVSFPMSGSLEMKTENEYENADYGQNIDKVHSTHSVLMSQYSGGLTKKAAAVLADLLASNCAYHLVNGEWRRIVIEEAETTIVGEDSLQFCSFKFRYVEDVPVRKIV